LAIVIAPPSSTVRNRPITAAGSCALALGHVASVCEIPRRFDVIFHHVPEQRLEHAEVDLGRLLPLGRIPADLVQRCADAVYPRESPGPVAVGRARARLFSIRGERFTLALQCGFPAFYGPFAVARTRSIRSN
jgi:hypothetical protein